MLLINRSPGMFIVLANIVVFGVIGVEIWMWTAASTLAVAGTLTMIVVVAGVICLSAVHLIDDAAGTPAAAPAAKAQPPVMTAVHVAPEVAAVTTSAEASAAPRAGRAPRRTVAHV